MVSYKNFLNRNSLCELHTRIQVYFITTIIVVEFVELLSIRYHGDCIRISEKEAKLIRQYFCERCQEEDPTLQTRWKTKRDENSTSVVTKEKDEQKVRKRKDRNDKSDKKNKKCGDCMGCYRTEDCGRCDVCTRRKNNSSSRQKERCKQRICVNYGG